MSISIPGPTVDFLHGELQARRARLVDAIPRAADSTALQTLLQDVDAALERMARGTYGICET
jgi:hypothetical protein